jgi:trehalose 6-phosphate phosphatase
MQILNPGFNFEIFFQKVAAAPTRVLMLDYDGTLAPFRVERDRAKPYPGVVMLLNAIAEHTRLVIVSGRPVGELRQLLKLRATPELWGSHGWERLATNGSYTLGGWPRRYSIGLIEARQLLLQHKIDKRLEEKFSSLAIHFRGLGPHQAVALEQTVRDELTPLLAHSGLELHRFDGGLELRVPGRTKGTAVATILNEVSPDAALAYLGDDLTDEDAFVALKGRGASVLIRPELRETAAQLWLRPPEELLMFLDRWNVVCRQPQIQEVQR